MTCGPRTERCRSRSAAQPMAVSDSTSVPLVARQYCVPSYVLVRSIFLLLSFLLSPSGVILLPPIPPYPPPTYHPTPQPCSCFARTFSRTSSLTGRVEFRIFLVLYFLTIPLQLLSTGSFLEQGSTALTAITAIHAGFVAATFWALLGNAIVSTQLVEDGTISSLLVSAFAWAPSASARAPSPAPRLRSDR